MANKLEMLAKNASQFNDILLVLLLTAIIGLMILPAPTPLLDTLIAVNMSISVILLLISNYITSPLAFSVFPTLLLFTTLFKLSLNVASTRLILLQADAGKIIQTFGEFVVGGNFVVGVVVFLVLTVVQFIVLAKGAERVAEVSARFTLDAMPGKQMSIDADMRSGAIDMAEARRLRERVGKESQFFGAMDGAMKFVKGDAIAAILIVGVNIIGGLTIGITQHGMSAEEALTTYSILSIGDGLVSQIPAIFICITAGTIVTRVTTEDSSSLGSDIGRQILNQPKALLIGGGLLLLMGLIPGFPKIQFFILATIFGYIGYHLLKVKKMPIKQTAEEALSKTMSSATQPDSAKKEKPGEESEEDEEEPITAPLLVFASSNLLSCFSAEDLNQELRRLRKTLFLDLGVPFPGINFDFADTMEPNSYVLMINEIPMARGILKPDKVFVRESAEHLRAMGFQFEEAERFLPGIETIWVDQAKAPLLDKAGFSHLTPPQVLSLHLSLLLTKYADEFVGMQVTKFTLNKVEKYYPDLCREAQRVVPVPKMSEIFQRLVQEGVSIRDMNTVLEALVEWGGKEKDVIMLTEYVRSSLKRQISYRYTGGQNILSAYILDPGVEETVRDAIRQTSTGSFLALPPDTSKALVDAVVDNVGDLTGVNPTPVLLTSLDIRRFVRKLIEATLYELPVLSYQELTAEVVVQPVGRITL
ncbi:type III secretion system export apparatus subunit SctV [Desulfovibrio inopinatus]|uniref:type III secretion system export apparatus subunit SctV n=1 Tax=Desulfovibrio inopinatus TaxID=102109 RepID=UPI0003F8F6DF|nr:type III secretion system export apparatus subunit SctV [Desulfovibrio inopinatus]